MQSITLTADEHLIAAAQARAQAEHTTLDEVFERWLADYALSRQNLREYDAVVQQVCGSVTVGRKLTRDEMNER